MIDHLNYDVTNLEKSSHFFEKALGALGYRKLADLAEYGVVGFGDDRPRFWICRGDPHAQPNEVHVCFSAATRRHVNDFYVAALEAGGMDNGPPGLRPEYHANYYAAFVLDPDGFNIEAVCHEQE